MAEWATATAIENLWLNNEAFVRADFDQYLEAYRQSTRIRLIPTRQRGQMEPASVTDMYPLHGIGGPRYSAVRSKFMCLHCVMYAFIQISNIGFLQNRLR